MKGDGSNRGAKSPIGIGSSSGRGPGKTRKNWLTAAILVAAVALAGWSVYVASATGKPQGGSTAGPVPVDVGTTGGAAAGAPSGLEARPEKGFLAPDFEATDIATGKKVRLSDLRGKPVFINFWATWCKWCKVEMPDIEKVYNAQKDKIHVLLVDGDYTETPEMMKKFAKDNSIALPMLHDEKGEVANTYLVRAFPSSVFINKAGVITAVYPGALNERQMKLFLEEAAR